MDGWMYSGADLRGGGQGGPDPPPLFTKQKKGKNLRTKLGEKSIYVQFRMPPDVRMHRRPTKIDWLLGGLSLPHPQPVGPPLTETMNFKSSDPTLPKFMDPPLVLVDVLVNVY